MEWVETTGRTIEDAKEAALDELGVDEQDAEFEVLEEPKLGLFGRLRNEGRVRARVRPVAPPAKDERRRRGRNGSRSGGGGGTPGGAGGAGGAAKEPTTAADAVETEGATPAPRPPRNRGGKGGGGGGGRNGGGRTAPVTVTGEDGGEAPASSDAPATNGPKRNPERVAAAAAERSGPTARTGDGSRTSGRRAPSGQAEGSSRGEGQDVEVSLDEQSQVAEEFLRGLVAEFGVNADIASSQPDEDTLDLALTGADLGMLIGPKGATLLALQDLTRTVVQRKTGASNGRIHVDVGGYRQKRSEALSKFAHQVADHVKSSGVRKALEPMSAPDRKVVHDALTDVDGVTTASEGEDAARRVVILPAD